MGALFFGAALICLTLATPSTVPALPNRWGWKYPSRVSALPLANPPSLIPTWNWPDGIAHLRTSDPQTFGAGLHAPAQIPGSAQLMPSNLDGPMFAACKSSAPRADLKQRLSQCEWSSVHAMHPNMYAHYRSHPVAAIAASDDCECNLYQIGERICDVANSAIQQCNEKCAHRGQECRLVDLHGPPPPSPYAEHTPDAPAIYQKANFERSTLKSAILGNVSELEDASNARLIELQELARGLQPPLSGALGAMGNATYASLTPMPSPLAAVDHRIPPDHLRGLVEGALNASTVTSEDANTMLNAAHALQARLIAENGVIDDIQPFLPSPSPVPAGVLRGDDLQEMMNVLADSIVKSQKRPQWLQDHASAEQLRPVLGELRMRLENALTNATDPVAHVRFSLLSMNGTLTEMKPNLIAWIKMINRAIDNLSEVRKAVKNQNEPLGKFARLRDSSAQLNTLGNQTSALHALIYNVSTLNAALAGTDGAASSRLPAESAGLVDLVDFNPSLAWLHTQVKKTHDASDREWMKAIQLRASKQVAAILAKHDAHVWQAEENASMRAQQIIDVVRSATEDPPQVPAQPPTARQLARMSQKAASIRQDLAQKIVGLLAKHHDLLQANINFTHKELGDLAQKLRTVMKVPKFVPSPITAGEAVSMVKELSTHLDAAARTHSEGLDALLRNLSSAQVARRDAPEGGVQAVHPISALLQALRPGETIKAPRNPPQLPLIYSQAAMLVDKLMERLILNAEGHGSFHDELRTQILDMINEPRRRDTVRLSDVFDVLNDTAYEMTKASRGLLALPSDSDSQLRAMHALLAAKFDDGSLVERLSPEAVSVGQVRHSLTRMHKALFSSMRTLQAELDALSSSHRLWSHMLGVIHNRSVAEDVGRWHALNTSIHDKWDLMRDALIQALKANLETPPAVALTELQLHSIVDELLARQSSLNSTLDEAHHSQEIMTAEHAAWLEEMHHIYNETAALDDRRWRRVRDLLEQSQGEPPEQPVQPLSHEMVMAMLERRLHRPLDSLTEMHESASAQHEASRAELRGLLNSLVNSHDRRIADLMALLGPDHPPGAFNLPVSMPQMDEALASLQSEPGLPSTVDTAHWEHLRKRIKDNYEKSDPPISQFRPLTAWQATRDVYALERRLSANRTFHDVVVGQVQQVFDQLHDHMDLVNHHIDRLPGGNLSNLTHAIHSLKAMTQVMAKAPLTLPVRHPYELFPEALAKQRQAFEAVQKMGRFLNATFNMTREMTAKTAGLIDVSESVSSSKDAVLSALKKLRRSRSNASDMTMRAARALIARAQQAELPKHPRKKLNDLILKKLSMLVRRPRAKQIPLQLAPEPLYRSLPQLDNVPTLQGMVKLFTPTKREMRYVAKQARPLRQHTALLQELMEEGKELSRSNEEMLNIMKQLLAGPMAAGPMSEPPPSLHESERLLHEFLGLIMNQTLNISMNRTPITTVPTPLPPTEEVDEQLVRRVELDAGYDERMGENKFQGTQLRKAFEAEPLLPPVSPRPSALAAMELSCEWRDRSTGRCGAPVVPMCRRSASGERIVPKEASCWDMATRTCDAMEQRPAVHYPIGKANVPAFDASAALNSLRGSAKLALKAASTHREHTLLEQPTTGPELNIPDHATPAPAMPTAISRRHMRITEVEKAPGDRTVIEYCVYHSYSR